MEELEKIANNEAAEPNEKEKISLNLEDEANVAAAGLLGSGMNKEAVLGIIQDADSCQDSDFSGDDQLPS